MTSQPKPGTTRRHFIAGAVAGIASIAGPFRTAAAAMRSDPVRWGFVGTGSIANSMGRVVQGAPSAVLAASSSRRLSSAETFAQRYGAEHAFDSWREMLESDTIDAVYIATPTSVKEEIALHAARNGKHVLAEKPLDSLASLQRMTAACREHRCVFMDATHFVHHPRTQTIQSARDSETGEIWSLDSAFQFYLSDRNNIRFDRALEPMGAIGDAGWYNMRAAVEYLPGADKPIRVDAHVRRDPETGAAISGSGILVFEDGSSSTWNCGFDSGSTVMDLRITGSKGIITIDDFLSQNADGSADYRLRRGSMRSGVDDVIKVESALPGAALMFEDFARLIADPTLRAASMTASERTQTLLDMAWASALANESS